MKQKDYDIEIAKTFLLKTLSSLDISKLGNCLTPSKKKLESKGIKSVKSRVANLKAIKPDLTIEKIKNALIASFKDVYGVSSNLVEINENDVDIELSNYLKSNQFLYEKTPQYNIELEKRFPFGNVVMNLNIKNNKVKTVKIYSDSLDMNVYFVEDKLKGELFKEDLLWNIVETYKS